MTNWNPCMSLITEPMAVPSAAKTMAIMATKRKATGNGKPGVRAEAGDEADDKDQRALDDGDRCAAQCASDHDLHARDRSHQRLLQEAELPIPEHGNTREDGAEEDRHADNARSHEL